MKTRILAALLFLLAGLQTAWAQGFRVYQSDGTELQFSLKTDSIVFDNGLEGDEVFGPFTPVNMCIAKTWYINKYETVTFNPDGTTDYIDDTTYKFFPYQGNLVIYNAGGVPLTCLRVLEVTAERMVVNPIGSNRIVVLTSTPQPVLVQEIQLSNETLTLKPDETKNLTATVFPLDADNPEVSWESSDETVAEVNKNGRVIGNAAGTCIITCRATDGSGVYAECQVTVATVVYVSEIMLYDTSISVDVGKMWTIIALVVPDNATNKKVAWESSDEAIATVDEIGQVTGVGSGTCTITCRATDGSGVYAECQATVKSNEYVDLGLPSGTLWATCNVGAEKPEEYGDFFAWGETEPKENYNWSTYKYCQGSNDTMTKYCIHSICGYSGFVDDKTELDPEDDPATANKGSEWQMPSIYQFDELINSDYTTTEWTTLNGVDGRLITSKSNGKSIFLPAAGCYYEKARSGVGNKGYYWSRSLFTGSSAGANYLSFSSDDISKGFVFRFYGQSIRPVRKQ